MRLASAEDFRDGALYSNYRRYPFFAERAAMIRRRVSPSASVLIAGCGYGYLVDELRKIGVRAWGCDLSPWAVGQASQVIPATATFVLLGDVTDTNSLNTVRAAAGLPGNQDFALVVTEDVLPMLTDAEIAAALEAVRTVGSAVLHIVTPGDPTDTTRASGVTWKPIAAWRALCAPDPVMDAERGTIA